MGALAKIRKEGRKWVVYNEDETKRLGEYDTKEEAEKRLREVEYFKHNGQAAQAARRARYLSAGYLALAPKAFGQEYEIKLALESGEPEPFDRVGEVAVIRISGPLEQHPNWCWQDYETIRACAEAAFASSARAVALRINSPGGAAAGCVELSRALRAMSEDSQKPLGVFVDGMAASAAYVLAASATPGRLAAPPTSTVASLAVYEAMIDQTAADAAIGVKFVFVTSTGADLKLTGNPHVAATDAQKAHVQEQVDLLADHLDALVSDMRGLTPDGVRALRGATLLASQGVDKGLVDVVSDWTAFMAKLQTAEGLTMTTPQAKAAKAEDEKKSPFESAIEALTEAAKADDETGTAAKKMLADHYKALHKAAEGGEDDEKAKADEADGDGGEKPNEKPGDDKAKAEEDEKPKRAAAEEEERKAQARASAGPSFDVARELQELKASLAARDARDAKAAEDAKRAELLASRPDFSDAQRKTLATVPLKAVEDAVKNWPRINVRPGAAAAAAVPGATPGASDAAAPGIHADQQALLDRLDRQGMRAEKARSEGSNFYLSFMTPEAAAKRAAEMREQGLSPEGASQGAPRIPTRGFQTAK